MPYQTAITVKTALDRIWKHEYVLPAIQREFVWNPKQIGKLFDSLMQGFPVGSFPFWNIGPKTPAISDSSILAASLTSATIPIALLSERRRTAPNGRP